MFKIVNKTNLSYEMIGKLIDEWLELDKGNTHYFGQLLYTDFSLNGKNYVIHVRYMKQYVEFSVKER